MTAHPLFILSTALIVATTGGTGTVTVLPGASVQAALDRAPAGAVIVVEGHHAEALTIRKPVTLRGGAGARLSGAAVPLIEVIGARGVLIERLVATQSGRAAPRSNHGVIVVRDAEAELRAVRIEGATAGLVVTGGAKLRAAGLEVSRCGGAGVLFAGGSTGELTGSEIHHNAVGVWAEDDAAPILRDNAFTGNRLGLLFTGHARPRVEANRVVRSTGRGVSVTGDAVPALIGNTIEGSGEEGLVFIERARGVAQANRVRGNVYGVFVGDDAAPTLRHNMIEANRKAGVLFRHGRGGGLLEGNLLHANDRFGVQLSGPAAPTLRANTVVGHLRCGVHAANGASAVLERNVVTGNRVGVSNEAALVADEYRGASNGKLALTGDLIAGNADADLVAGKGADVGLLAADTALRFAEGGWFVLTGAAATGTGPLGWAGPPAGAASLLPGPVIAVRPRAAAPSPAAGPAQARPAKPELVAAADLKAIQIVGEEFEAAFMEAVEESGNAEIPGRFLSRAFAELEARDVNLQRLKAAREYLKRAQRAGETAVYGPAFHELDQFLRRHGV